MRFILKALSCVVPLIWAGVASAQVLPAPEPVPEPRQIPEFDRPQVEIRPDPQTVPDDAPDAAIEGEDIVPEDLAPDYSQLSPKAEREARLNDLYENLLTKTNPEDANLVAEEIVAIWMDSGSASVDLLLRRGAEAETKGDAKLARTMYNYVVDLSPEHAEGWARSARLALTQKDYNRALNESLKTLNLEPRHFYTLWTLGNVLEALNRPDEALEAYREANGLYPELIAVKERLEELEGEVEGTVL